MVCIMVCIHSLLPALIQLAIELPASPSSKKYDHLILQCNYRERNVCQAGTLSVNETHTTMWNITNLFLGVASQFD